MRRILLVLLAVVVALAVGGAAWRYVAAEDPGGRLIVAEITGPVTLAGEGRATAPVERGTVLVPSDELATGPDGRVVLELTPGTRIRLGPSSSVMVKSVERDAVQLELENGQLQATVRPDSGAVRVGSHGRQAVATQGEFSVGVRGDIMQVAAEKGTVTVTGVDPPTTLAQGQQATVVAQKLETDRIPPSMLLAVEWPQRSRTRAVTQALTGQTSPGAEVGIDGSFGHRSVRADASGHFAIDLPLAEGDNPVQIHAIDILGRETKVSGALAVRDTTGPTLRSE
jgi:hypothetical protein